MRRIERPSARFLGLLHGQAVIRGDSNALSLVEARAHERGIMQSVARHSSAYIVRRFSLDWMQAHDSAPAPMVADAAEAPNAPEAPIARVRRDQIETASHPMLRTVRGASHRAAPHSRH